MTEPTSNTPSDASATAPAPAAAAAPAAGGDSRRQGQRPQDRRDQRPAGGKPVLNSAMADALRAATKGHALEVGDAPAAPADSAPEARQDRQDRQGRRL